MAVFYLDFENGNDANNGTTFANRWKTLTSGATAARIAPGDEIRIMGSPAPTSLGQNGVWTSQALQSTKNISSSTNASPISITCTAHGYSTGDTVVITGHTTNTEANGTWEITVTGTNTFTLDGSVGNGVGGATGSARLRNNTRVTLTTAVTQNIASTGPRTTAWTNAGGANTSTQLQTGGTPPPKEHQYHEQITINTAFTTGKVAYYTLPSTLDLSSYQQISFWFGVALAATTIAANSLELRLCSDTVGDTAVDTFVLPALPGGARYMPVTLDKGSALGSSISSIALYVTTDLSTTANITVFLNNIIACKASSAADSLTLTSLIGKNTTGETFWGIQSINGRRVMLDADTNGAPNSASVRGYYGTSGTVTTWKRETIKLGPAASGTTSLQTIQDSGSDGSPIVFSGGWDRTNMSTQTLETWLDGLNGNGRAIDFGINRNWVTMTNCAFTRFNTCLYFQSGNNLTVDVIALNNSQLGSDISIASIITQTIGHSVANVGNYAIKMSGARNVVYLKYSINSNQNIGIQAFSDPAYIYGITNSASISNNGGSAIIK